MRAQDPELDGEGRDFDGMRKGDAPIAVEDLGLMVYPCRWAGLGLRLKIEGCSPLLA